MRELSMVTDELELQRSVGRPLPTLHDGFSALVRQRRAMLIAFVLVVIAVGLSGMWAPKYGAEMKILVQRQRSDSIITSSASAPVQFIGNQVTEEDLNSEVELLNSSDLLRKVVLATGLDRKPGAPVGSSTEVSIATAVRALANTLKIEALRKSNVIAVHYENRDPKLAAAVLKALAVAYTEKHLEVHRASGEFQFFDQQVEQYRAKMEEAQKKLTEFTQGTGVVSAQYERDAALKQADEYETNAHQAQTSMMETEQRIHALQGQLQGIQPRMVTMVRSAGNPQLLQQLKSTLLTLELKRTELLTKYDPSYRLVQEVDKQIADTKKTIDGEDSKPVRDETTDRNPNYEWIKTELTRSQADLSGLQARAVAASSAASQLHEQARRLDQSGVEQQNLQRAEKTEEENYMMYVHKREEARINEDLDQRGILNVALAEPPMVPALPNRSPLIAAVLTLLLAGTLSVSTAFVLDLMDPSFRTPNELASYLGVPVLAALPKGRD